MSIATLDFFAARKWLDAPTKPQTVPERPRPGLPVFIGDAVTPWGGSTLLLAQLRAATDTDDDS